ncbi:arabinosyltransferase C [Saccharopolyspora lacisalsi]|uniref:Arabinosyltransferase C n=1 Tax=Halosaccharopolyspora lacisalsi TaxID=1000566 RepID=A0A839E700_9PSEU|nr:arabinosyltransferase domain-containing protein [Halosaccharopolyspora lacisalsi]MBA8827477.1 arabinosyltransferase C [Halosaccharopolyspora lacisalsi]
MRNAGQDDNGQPPPDEESPGGATKTRRGPVAKRLWITASVLGLLGAILSIAVPFLPVVHDITTLKWPTAQGTQAVSAPLVRYSPIELNASVPCQTARSLDARTQDQALVLGTNPPGSEYGKLTGMTLQVTGGQLTLLSKGRQLGTTPIPSGDCSISIHSDAFRTTAGVGNQPLADIHGEDRRPQLTGIYSDIDEQQDPTRGLSFSAQVDNRWSTQGTVLKFVVMGVAVLCFIGSVITLRKLDVRAGRRPPKLAPPGWWKPTLRDGGVFAALGVWWLIGAMTSDDGYILTIARARADAGYISNYFRWFAVPEAPFGWFYELYSLWVQVSTATPWVRLPALLMGMASWLLISREVLPRLGQQVRRSNASGWAAAAVFLAFWLPYNNGLRPEPVVVLFSLLSLAAVERAVAARRLMPAAVGLVGASLALGASPHGLVAVLPYIAALKPLIRLVRLRIQEFGWLPVLAPIAASGFVILNLVFWDQTWKSVAEATRVRTDIGPSHSWYEEFQRYSLLFSQSADGSMTRRFPVLLVILCLITCAVVLLRRGRIRGAALGPSRRLLGVTGMTFVVLMMVPTKWTHHFGIFAAVGGALAALTALATSGSVLRSRRNRAAFFAGLMLILAFAATGLNAWWYVSGWGIPWFNKPPSYHGYEASTFLLIIAGIALAVAFIEHLRTDEHNPTVVDVREQEKRSRALRLGTAPLSLICALLVLGELALFGKAIEEQWGSYSLGGDNLQTLAGGSQCGLSDSVYVERNPLAGMLPVSQRQPSDPAPDTDVPDRNAKEETPRQYLGARMEGFRRGGFPPGDGSETFEKDWQPPYGFGTDKAPVWGSYDPNGMATGELRTQWYDLPKRAREGQVPIVLSLAGSESGANSLFVEYGKQTEEGFEVLERRPVRKGPPPGWRDARISVDRAATGAEQIRVVAVDQSLGSDGWLSVSAPRVPRLTNMTEFIGDAPTFVEWTAAFQHPCLEVPSISHGIAEMPRFRVTAGGTLRSIGQGWSSPDAGGPFGWLSVTTSMRTLPTYLEGNIHRDWGTLYAVDPYAPRALPAQAAMNIRKETHWGTWTPGPLSKTVQLPGDVPSSDDRNDIKSFGNNSDSGNGGGADGGGRSQDDSTP